MISNDNIKNDKIYYVYIIECANGSLYTGITTDIDRRFEEHKASKKGAKYTKAFKPVKLRAVWKTKSGINAKSIASKLENRIKRLDRETKLLIIKNKRAFKKVFLEYFEFIEYNEFLRIF